MGSVLSLHLQDSLVQARLFSTGILLLLVILVRILGLRMLRGHAFPQSDDRRRWIVRLKNFIALALIFGLTGIWAEELRSVALGVTAIAVALVVATRELLLCLVGGVLKASAGLFNIGDRVEVGHHRGDVVDHNFMTTTLQEVGPDSNSQQYTGRLTIIPNSLFLSHAMIVERLSGTFILHTFKISLPRAADWNSHLCAISVAVDQIAKPYLDAARSFMSSRAQREGLEPPSAEPRISVDLSHHDHINLVVRLPVPARKRARMEQAILRSYLDKVTKPVDIERETHPLEISKAA